MVDLPTEKQGVASGDKVESSVETLLFGSTSPVLTCKPGYSTKVADFKSSFAYRVVVMGECKPISGGEPISVLHSVVGYKEFDFTASFFCPSFLRVEPPSPVTCDGSLPARSSLSTALSRGVQLDFVWEVWGWLQYLLGQCVGAALGLSAVMWLRIPFFCAVSRVPQVLRSSVLRVWSRYALRLR